MEFRQLTDRLTVEIREGHPPQIHGYAAKYYDTKDPGTEFQLWPGAKERIAPGAFDRAIASNQDVVALFNHDQNIVLGRRSAGTLKLSVDNVGLLYSINPPDTQAARDLIVGIQRGDIGGSSFSFTVNGKAGQAWWRKDDIKIRELRDLDLADISIVVSPAYRATTTGLRSEALAELRCMCETELPDEKQAEEEKPKTLPRSVAIAKARLAELGL